MKLTFCTFDLDLTTEIFQEILSIEPNVTRHAPKELIRAMLISARLFHPDCRLVILTDKKTPFHDLPSEIEIIRYEYDPRHVILQRTQAQIKFIEDSPGENILFLDYDILIQGNLEHLFLRDFDVGLTYRKHAMAINGGVIIIHGANSSAAVHFMQRIHALMKEKYQSFLTWYSDQLALQDEVKVPESLQNQTAIIRSSNTKILLLPCSIYNFTTHEYKMDGTYPDKLILHFKGKRKPYQIPYFEKHLLGGPKN